ncbi:SpvB/TcaC N-terminal domain-containing protein, partial [Treponema sp.]|uniref:SpvB/TcaC N-terminal domain-containing protein n=1 Tax=Treponema sp. TaxID=166 RepID=UPI00388D7E9F
MKRLNNIEYYEERKYGKRTAALVLTIMYMATLSPLYLFAEERRNSASVIENFSTSRNYASLNEISSSKNADEETDEKEILVAEAPEKHAERAGKADRTNRVSESKETAEAAVQESKLLITKKEGGVIELGRVRIEIPPKAVKEDTEISITRLLKVNETGETLKNVTEESGGYRFLPKGTKFKKKVLISMPYSAELNLTEGELNELYTYFYDEEKAAWIKLERKEIDKENCLVKSYTTHFTDMINATLQVPETAGPVDFNINSIKSLEAAKPDGHLLKFNPPQGTSSGDAAFSFTLDVPAGRKGMQPQVSVGYSSAGGSGIMGKGFDVNYGSTISIDTRKKLPDYDESDAYLKDGVKLKANGSTNKEYRLLRRSVREKIERHNAFSKDDWWEITDTHGSVYRYGYYKAYETTTNNAYAGKKDENGKDKIYTWYLSEVEDVDGNTILYEYEKDTGYVYPSRITYTGNVNDPAHKEGKYIVKFNYIKSTDEKHREDVRVDARSRFVTECRWLLGSIESGHVNRTTRKYSFEYGEGLAKEKYLTAFNVSNGTTEKDSSYTYRFEYNELEKIKNDDGTETYRVFDDAEMWLSSEAQINNNIRKTSTNTDEVKINHVSMSSSSSTGYNVNGGFGVGVGGATLDARLTGGAGGSNSEGTGYTNSMLIDINGDSIPDIVKQKGNSIQVYLCKHDKEGKTFIYNDSADTVDIGTQINLEKTKNSSSTMNVYGGAGASKGGAGIAYAHTNSDGYTETKTGFADVDGDGLVDIITGSNKYYKNETQGENVKFTLRKIRDYASSCTHILTPEEVKEYSRKFFVQRPFKAWKVRDNGKVDIVQIVSGDGSLEGKVYVDENKKPATADELKNLDIKSGQYIYFVPDLKKGEEDWNKEFGWNVKIDYKTVKPFKVRDEEILLAIPQTTSLLTPYNSDLYLADKKLNKIANLYRVVEKPRDPQNTSGYTEYYATLKPEYYKEELSEAGLEYILKSKSYIPVKINNHRDYVKEADRKSFMAKLSKGEKASVHVILSSYVYDPVSDCFRFSFTGTQVAMSKINSVKEALEKVGFDYDEYTEDLEKDYAEVYIKTSADRYVKSIVYRKCSEEQNNTDICREDTTGKCVKGILIINDDILGKKITSFDTKKNILDTDESYKLDSYFEFDGKKYVRIRDKEDKYLITYTFAGFTNSVPELSDEEIHSIFESKYHETKISELIKNYINDTEVEKSEVDSYIDSIFENALRDGYLSDDDKTTFIGMLLEEDEDGYKIKDNLTLEYQEKIDDIDYKYGFYDFITTTFNFYTKPENSSNYWTLKQNLTDESREELEEICNDSGLGLYKITAKKIEYLEDGEYSLIGNKYSILILKENIWDEKEITFERQHNNSFEQYSEKNLVTENDFGEYTYSYEVTNYGRTETKNVNISLIATNEDCLYGGENGWLYGIWQGDESENKFSKAALNTKLDNKDYDETKSNTDYENEVSELGENEDCENIKKFDLSYYLPVKCSDVTENKPDEKIIKDTSVVGNIDCLETSSVTDVDGNMKVERILVYSAPFINGDKFVCNRLGGNTYYNIDGIAGNNSDFVISKSRNKSKEDSYGPSVTVSVVSASQSTNKSKGTAYQEQSLQDVTGDRIPDIIQSQTDGKSIIIKKGVIDKETNELYFVYDDESTRYIGGYLSESSNDTTTYQGSVSASGSGTDEKFSAKGNLKSVSMKNATGTSFGYGSNEQTAGFIDLNDDGITDYIKRGSYKIGNGKGYEDYSAFGGNVLLQKTSVDIKGYNIGAEIDGGPYGWYDAAGKQVLDYKSHLQELCEQENSPNKANYAQRLACSANFGYGGSVSSSMSGTKQMYLDVNGDGLLDIIGQHETGNGVIKEVKTVVRFNTGNSFTDEFEIFLPLWNDKTKENPLSSNVSSTVYVSGSAGISFNISIVIPIVNTVINFTTSVGGGNNRGSTVNLAEITMTDLDGDGIADQVLQVADGSIYWKKNLTGKSGLLKTVILPQGGKYEIGYEGEYGTTNNPGFKYVMSEVKVSDGIGEVIPEIEIKNDEGEIEEDIHKFVTKFKYEDAYFDREEKDSYGFNKVKTIFSDESYSENTYSTTGTEYSYNLMGTMMSSVAMSGKSDMYDIGEDRILSKTEVDYLDDEEWVLTLDEKSEVYEKDGSSILNATTYDYDEYGNVIYIKQKTSDSSLPEVHAYISYNQKNDAKYIVSNPTDIKVFDHKAGSGSGNYLRYRHGHYDDNGHLDSLSQYYEDSKALTTLIAYDGTYGNIKSIKDSVGVTLKYDYDNEMNQFIEKISQVSADNSESYVSTIEYDKEQQIKTKETDCNKNSMEYEYDNWQRIVSIKSPKDSNGIKAISYEYYCPDTKVKKTQDG